MKLSNIVRGLLYIGAELGLFGEPRVIYDRDGGSPYLSRYYLWNGKPYMPDGSFPYNAKGNPKEGAIFPADKPAILLHRFHRSDDDLALHNHPWRWAISLILAGGYREEKRVVEATTDPRQVAYDKGGAYESLDRGHHVEVREFHPGDINVLTSDTFHRVDLLDTDAWSLFITGPKFASWGFWDRDDGSYTPWRTFIARKRGNDNFTEVE